MSYKSMEIWQLVRELVIDIHRMPLHDLPKFEMYEEGGQIRRSIKSVKSTSVEGYGRRSYKQEFIRFLTYAAASNDETADHLDTLYETGSLANQEISLDLKENVWATDQKDGDYERQYHHKKRISGGHLQRI